jgi:hypothetical protein
VAKLQGIVTEISNLNEGLFKYVNELESRIVRLERQNTHSRSLLEMQEDEITTGAGIRSSERSQYQQDLEQDVNASMSAYGLMSAFPALLPTPSTPVAEVSTLRKSCVTWQWNFAETHVRRAQIQGLGMGSKTPPRFH